VTTTVVGLPIPYPPWCTETQDAAEVRRSIVEIHSTDKESLSSPSVGRMLGRAPVEVFIQSFDGLEHYGCQQRQEVLVMLYSEDCNLTVAEARRGRGAARHGQPAGRDP